MPPKDAAGKNLNQQMKRIEELNTKINKLKTEGRELGKDMRQLSILKENNEKIFGNSFTGNFNAVHEAEHKSKKTDLEK